jgi:hypothetical protein
MANTKEKWQEIANRGLQDKFDPETRARFDEAVNRGLINLPSTYQQAAQEQPAVKQPEEVGFLDQALGGLESAASIVSGALAEPISGIVGLADAANPFAPEGAGGVRVKQIKEALTYKPRTSFGKAEQLAVAEKLQPIASAIKDLEDSVGEGALEMTGSPVLAAIAKALPAATAEVATLGTATPALTATRQIAKGADGLDLATQARREAFESEGVAATRGDVTQDLPQQKIESQLFEQADEIGDQARKIRLQQSTDIKNRLESLINNTGIPEELGESVKQALTTRKGDLKTARSDAYKALSESTQGINLPISTSAIKKSFPDAGEIRDIAGLAPQQAKVLDSLLKEFMVVGSEGLEQLSVSNFEKFRKRLNAIEKSDQTGQISRATVPIKKALDEEVDLITKNLMENGSPNVAENAKQARKSHISLKTEFDDKALTSTFINNKRKSNIAQVENSQVYQKLSSKSTPIEQFSQVIDSLRESGNSGVKALSDLKNRMIVDIIDSSFSAGSRKIIGERTFGTDKYQKTVDTLKPKINKLFSPKEINRIENLYKIAENIRPPSGAVPKGSAGFFIDLMNKAGITAVTAKVPLGGLAVDQITELSKRAKNRKALERSLELPKYKDTVKTIKSDYPALAAILGIGAATGIDNDS